MDSVPAKKTLSNQNCLILICEYLEISQLLQIQQATRIFYAEVVPKAMLRMGITGRTGSARFIKKYLLGDDQESKFTELQNR